MNIPHSVDDKSGAVKRLELIEKELDQRPGGVASPFYLWLHSVKRIPLASHVGYAAKQISPALWAEWLAAKPVYLAACAAKSAALSAEIKKQEDAERATKLAVEKREAAISEARIKKMIELQSYVFKPIDLEPVDFEELHALKKHPEQSKRRLARRWCERFDALPANVQTAWRAFHSVHIMAATAEVDPADTGDDMADDDMSASGAQWTYFNEFPPGKRGLQEDILPEILAGLRDRAYHDFRKFNEGVRRLIGLIGNPLDRAIVPPANPHRPQPAQDVDELPDNPAAHAHIIPQIMPRGWIIPHGNASAGKTVWLIKGCLVIADRNGAKFEGIEVEHGPVIYSTLDPSASRDEVRPDVIEIRTRLGLQPSGRFHLTDAPLILNEPASVEHWLELNRARLPAKVIVVDSLFSSTTGSLAQDTVVKGVRDGVVTLLRSCDAVVTPHHDNKSGDIFGSQYLTAMMAAKIAVVRSTLKDGRPGGNVTVTVERLKRADTYLKLAYTLDGPFLDLGANADASAGGADAMPIRRRDIWLMIPTTPTPLAAVWRKIEGMLTGTTAKSRSGQWKRLRDAWEARGLIMIEGGMIRRIPSKD
jgi:hypothetical protein